MGILHNITIMCSAIVLLSLVSLTLSAPQHPGVEVERFTGGCSRFCCPRTYFLGIDQCMLAGCNGSTGCGRSTLEVHQMVERASDPEVEKLNREGDYLYLDRSSIPEAS